MSYASLQNGSDIRGIALPGPEGQAVNLTPQAVAALAAAFGRWLKARTGLEKPRVSLGRDSRITGPTLVDAAVQGLCSEGIACTVFGLASTPAMFMSTVLDGFAFDGAVMITASHLPYYRNGMKFFVKEGGLEGSQIKELTALADTLAPVTAEGHAETADFMSAYALHLCDCIRKGVNAADYAHPLKGLHVIVDAGNGAGGFFAQKVLQPLGADTEGSLYLEPDGHFPHHIPNPEDKTAAECIRRATLAAKADLGIIFDTDVDRAGAVLPNGEALTRNALIAILSDIVLRSAPGTTIVTDSVTSTGLAAFIAARGGVHRRFKRGYKNVINEAIRLNAEGIDSQLAIETSGHGALKENYFLDDGAYLMVKLLIELGRGASLTAMVDGLAQPAESSEFRMPLPDTSKADGILALLQQAAGVTPGWSLAPDNFEGVRINCDEAHGSGWLLLRKSLHEPLMPLNIESDVPGGVAVIAAALQPILARADGLDIAPLADYVAAHA